MILITDYWLLITDYASAFYMTPTLADSTGPSKTVSMQQLMESYTNSVFVIFLNKRVAMMNTHLPPISIQIVCIGKI